MKIIMLVGPGGTGKTTTLKKVYERLSNNIQPKYYQEINKNPDIECYPLYHHDKKIALCSAGDTLNCITKPIIKFCCMGMDVIIIAFSEDKLLEEAKKYQYKELEIKLFFPDFLKDIQSHCIIQKRVTGTANALPTDDENNEKDCQAIIDRI